MLLLFNTLKYLKSKQIYYRLYYLLRKKIRRATGFEYSYVYNYTRTTSLTFQDFIVSPNSFESGAFTFLNLTHTFNDSIDWNYSKYGKLWAYNLNYFDYLSQKDFCVDDGLSLINSFINDINGNREGLEPFPISLRVINWIKFINKHDIRKQNIDASLHAQFKVLMDNLEYQHMGNHLLENSFSLLFGAYYFHDVVLYQKAKQILLCELNEQILPDGGHFELSPMYHQLILNRLLDCINLMMNNDLFNKDLLDIFIKNAERMLGWIRKITFRNGDIPLFNDSANNIASTTQVLDTYAEMLGVRGKEINLRESGYQKINRSNYEMVVDVGRVGPDYTPAHAHSDTFNFELHMDNIPFIVDTGISTYEKNQIRQNQRSTLSHNTVQIEDYEQTEVWGGFRVARRAYVEGLKYDQNGMSASHTGYKRFGAIHKRGFAFNEKGIEIKDEVVSRRRFNCYSYLHFHPDVQIDLKGKCLFANSKKIVFKHAESVVIKDYEYAPEFNKTVSAKMVVSSFQDRLTTTIIV
ncbi:MAG: alginate lyase family protein [Candidatus Scalindua sp. SCAELEC01]|nr:alginate lyase family protein [Planctomycetota bacterium]RZV68739.1 MAG: alginate lyase family protein [Candidatus Scalindua sp. SCAELEC01]